MLRWCRYMSESQYDMLMDRLKREFEDPPFKSAAVGGCAMFLCMLTGGLCFCPCLYIKKKVDAFNLRLDSVANAAVKVSRA